jgi:hypothetical protein
MSSLNTSSPYSQQSTSSESNSSSSSSPSSSIGIFILITSIYFVFKYNTSKANYNIYFGIYALILIISQFMLNMSLTKSICGTNQLPITLYITLVPFLLIFGVLKVMLAFFPGWLSPFSNTFGYGMTRLFGIGELFNKIFKPKLTKEEMKKENIGAMSEALEHIYTDKSLLINEITPDNFNIFWKDMSPLFNEGVYNNNSLKEKLFRFIILKDIVSEYIWYMLTGILVTSIGYNYLVNNGCSQSVKEMKDRHKNYMKIEESIAEQNKNKKQRVYTVHE